MADNNINNLPDGQHIGGATTASLVLRPGKGAAKTLTIAPWDVDGSSLGAPRIVATSGNTPTLTLTGVTLASVSSVASSTGTSGVTTDAASLVAAFGAAVSNGMVTASPGAHDITTAGPLAMLSGVTFVGNGANISHTGGGANPIVMANSVSNWTIDNLKLTGHGTGAEVGIEVDGTAVGGLIHNVTASGFGAISGGGTGAAFFLDQNSSGDPYVGVRVSTVIGKNSSSGITVNDLAEYSPIENSHFYDNYQGMTILSGNFLVNGCTITSNASVGINIFPGSNNGHGEISGCLINHNGGTAVICNDLTNGMEFDSCYVYADSQVAFEINDSDGVQINNCGISGPILLSGTQVGPSFVTNCTFKTPEKTYVEAASQSEFNKLIMRNNVMKGGGEFWLDELKVGDALTQTAGLQALWLSNHGACFRFADVSNGNRGQNMSLTDGSHAVAAWRDRSWNNKTFTLWNNTNYPDYETGDFNGVPSIKFTRASSEMLEMAQVASSAQSGMILLGVLPTDDTGDNVILYQGSSTDATSYFAVRRKSADEKLCIYLTDTRHFSCDTTLFDVSVPHVVLISSSGSTHVVYIDGVLQSLTYSSGSNDGVWFGDMTTDDVFCIGGQHYNSTTANFFGGCVGLVGIYDITNMTDNPQQGFALMRRAKEEFRIFTTV